MNVNYSEISITKKENNGKVNMEKIIHLNNLDFEFCSAKSEFFFVCSASLSTTHRLSVKVLITGVKSIL